MMETELAQKLKDLNQACLLLLEHGIDPPREVYSACRLNTIPKPTDPSPSPKDSEPRYFWGVVECLRDELGERDLAQLQYVLNENTKIGWEVFQILPDFTVILRRPADEDDEMIHTGMPARKR